MDWCGPIIPHYGYSFIKIFKVKLLRSISISTPRVSNLKKLTFFQKSNPSPTTYARVILGSYQMQRVSAFSSLFQG